jgi:hypothetical protein
MLFVKPLAFTVLFIALAAVASCPSDKKCIRKAKLILHAEVQTLTHGQSFSSIQIDSIITENISITNHIFYKTIDIHLNGTKKRVGVGLFRSVFISTLY